MVIQFYYFFFQIGHVKVSEKPIVKLDQICDDANDNTYLFITDDQGKQWRQLLEQKSSGFTWCGANEMASNPKTPTLEKAALCQRPTELEGAHVSSSQSDDDFTARLHRVTASLKQRLSASRKLFDRRPQGQNGHSSDLLTVPTAGTFSKL